jgi:adenylate cyclase
MVAVKGKTQAVRVCGLFGGPDAAAAPEFQRLAALQDRWLAAWRGRRWDEAESLIRECLALDTPAMRLRRYYSLCLERVAAFRAAPPPEGWLGESRALEK